MIAASKFSTIIQISWIVAVTTAFESPASISLRSSRLTQRISPCRDPATPAVRSAALGKALGGRSRRSSFGGTTTALAAIDLAKTISDAALEPAFSALRWLNSFYKNNPVQAAALTCGVKASLSDRISQARIEAEHRFCWSRNSAFILYGSLYQGVAQHFIFNEIYPAVFGSGTDVGTVASKVLFDQLVLTPFLCLPVAYLVKAAVFKRPLREGLSHYLGDAKKDLLWKYWLLWTPVQCLTFTVVPDHLRIPFIAVVSFFWLIILSSISSRPEPSSDLPASVTGKNVICYDNECIIMDEIDDVVDFPGAFRAADKSAGGSPTASPDPTNGR